MSNMAAQMRTQRQIAQSAISKGMRQRGFAGSAPHYFMDLPDAWLVVTLNHGRGFAAPGASSFTGDVWTSSKAILRVRGIDPTTKPRRAESHSEMRIGSLMRPPYDRWWTTADDMTD